DLERVLRRGVLFHFPDTADESTFRCAPDMLTLAFGDTAGRLHLQDLATGNELKTFVLAEPGASGPCDIAFSPNQHVLAWTDKEAFGVIDYTTGEAKTQSIEANPRSSIVRFSPDGRQLAFTTRTN